MTNPWAPVEQPPTSVLERGTLPTLEPIKVALLTYTQANLAAALAVVDASMSPEFGTVPLDYPLEWHMAAISDSIVAQRWPVFLINGLNLRVTKVAEQGEPYEWIGTIQMAAWLENANGDQLATQLDRYGMAMVSLLKAIERENGLQGGFFDWSSFVMEQSDEAETTANARGVGLSIDVVFRT